jgi:hypothetical protein
MLRRSGKLLLDNGWIRQTMAGLHSSGASSNPAQAQPIAAEGSAKEEVATSNALEGLRKRLAAGVRGGV